MRIEKINRKTVVEQVMDKIKELISSGEFKANDKLPTENELAEMLGIGRSTIREAIKLFNYLGILKSTPGVGTFVCERSNISTEALTWSILLGDVDMFELIELRMLMEERGLSALTEIHKKRPIVYKEDIHSLEIELANIKKAVAHETIESIVEADYEFHGIIIRASNISLFNEIYKTLREFMREEIIKSMRQRLDDVIHEHTQYLDSIKSGDLKMMKNTLEMHIEQIKKDIKRRLSS